MPEENEIDINTARPFSISKDQFSAMLISIKVPHGLNYDFLFETFCMIAEGIKGIQQENPTIARMAINPFELALYLVNQHSFYLATHPDIAKNNAFLEQEGYQSYLASVSLDKFYTNERLAYQMGSLTSRFSPAMSTLDLYINFILGMLSRYKRNDPTNTLIVDIMNKGFQIAKCVSTLLEGGYETEAFSTWRTMHENECILTVIVKYGKPVIDSYLRHMKYGAAFRGGLPTKEEIDETFVEIKENMRAAGLKSKDMKRYIEYGWLFAVSNIDQIPDVKLNFRDGVQRVAGLSAYSKVYEMSSEVAHSSPLLIYSRKNYFFSLTLLSLFESFFRLEKIFTTLYMSSVSEEERQRYIRMRTLYLGDLQICYDMERKRFASFAKKKKPEEK